jgi:uncharacterized protein (DUF2236 family)
LLHRRIEALAADLLAAPGVPPVDFLRPAGEPALVSPDSVSWHVFKNPVTLFVGGVAAVLLELAEPRVRHGVWDHSGFRADPLRRLQRTGLAAMVTVYGAADGARAMIAGVTRMHARVRGTTPAGVAYDALDPELLTWVQATAAGCFLEAYLSFVRILEPAEWDRYWMESRPVAQLYGAGDAPASNGEWQELLDRMRPRLEPSAVMDEFLGIMARVPVLPRLARPAQRLLLKAAVSILPAGIAEQIRIDTRRWHVSEREHRLVSAMARAADRTVIRTWPAVQACRRLGLPDHHLYR